MRTTRWTVAAAAVLVALVSATPAFATTISWSGVGGDHRFETFVNGAPDQVNLTAFPANGSSGSFVDALQFTAQTFTVGASGLLTRIDLGLFKNPGTVGDVTLDLFAFSGALPSELTAPLFHTIIPIASISLLTLTPTIVDLSSGPVSVQSGSQLAIVLSRSAPRNGAAEVIWQDSGIGGYAGGSFFTGRPIPTPEPASMLLLGTGVVGAGLRRRRKR